MKIARRFESMIIVNVREVRPSMMSVKAAEETPEGSAASKIRPTIMSSEIKFLKRP